MTWIEPLELQTWFMGVFAGSGEIFLAVALLVIITMAAYFRMTGLTMGIMLFTFVLMFSGFIPSTMMIFIAIIAGLVLGYVISRIVKN